MGEEMTSHEVPRASVLSAAGSEPKTMQAISGKGFGRRAVAYIIDLLILSALNFIGFVAVFIFLTLLMLVIFYPNSEVTSFLEKVSTPGRASLLLVSSLISLVYFVSFEGIYGATPGKLILGMRVINEKDGQPCNLKSALHRGLWRFIDGLLFGVIAYTNMEAPLQQRLGDKKAGTIVVGKDAPVIQETRRWPRFLAGLVLFIVIQTAISLIQIGITLF
jgi:uncharacterized RDD family membrane protein YckC